MTRPIFVEAVTDPNLLPTVYEACDQWCMYCPVTARCLAYRCKDPSAPSQNIHRTLADRLYEAITFTKQIAAAEGRETPELDAMLSDDPRVRAMIAIDDPIERMGRRYVTLSNAYLLSHHDFPFEMTPRPTGPTPFEVFAWYHALIAAKVYRALVSSAQAARGVPDRAIDALRSAKVTLIGIDRSLDALRALAGEDDDPRLELMQAHLRRLRRELEGRFPDARAFVRPGLDSATA